MEESKKTLENKGAVNIEDELLRISSEISTLEEWKEYIDTYYPIFCSFLAKKETSRLREGVNDTQKDNSKPIAIVTGGQPGAGKSALIPTYIQVLKEKYGIEAVVNNADFYRFCLPNSYRISEIFPEYASQLTDPVVKAIRKNLIQESIEQEQSIIIENTLGDTLAVDQMIQSDTHDIWLAIMAVPREESLLSDYERFIKMKEKTGISRLVSIEAHDIRYNALERNIQLLHKKGLRVILHSRGKTEDSNAIVEYDTGDTCNMKYASISDAITSIRMKGLRDGIPSYEERLAYIKQKLSEYGMLQEGEFDKLNEIIQLSLESRGK